LDEDKESVNERIKKMMSKESPLYQTRGEMEIEEEAGSS
jgi:hypothetical protein